MFCSWDITDWIANCYREISNRSDFDENTVPEVPDVGAQVEWLDEMANKGATVPELAAIARWLMDTAAKSMDTYVVFSGPLADADHGRRGKNIK